MHNMANAGPSDAVVAMCAQIEQAPADTHAAFQTLIRPWLLTILLTQSNRACRPVPLASAAAVAERSVACGGATAQQPGSILFP